MVLIFVNGFVQALLNFSDGPAGIFVDTLAHDSTPALRIPESHRRRIVLVAVL